MDPRAFSTGDTVCQKNSSSWRYAVLGSRRVWLERLCSGVLRHSYVEEAGHTYETRTWEYELKTLDLCDKRHNRNSYVLQDDLVSAPSARRGHYYRAQPLKATKAPKAPKGLKAHKHPSKKPLFIKALRPAEPVVRTVKLSTFPSPKRAEAKDAMNAAASQMVSFAGAQRILVLDDPASMRTSACISQLACVQYIVVPNDVTRESEEKTLLLGRVPVILKAGKLGQMLANNPELTFDAALLDFCGQLKTCFAEIRECVRRLRIADGGSAPFLVTLSYRRGGAPVEVSRSAIEDLFFAEGLRCDLEKRMLSNGMVTFFWMLRKTLVL